MGKGTLSVNRTLTLMIIYSSVGLLMTNSVVLASFNLYMDRYEAQKLLGLPSDIYYVREGVVNEYALNFTVKVPATVEHLRFSWQSYSKKPIQYEMVIEYTNFFALLPPVSNISNVGRIPGKLESFRITLPCSGRINAEVAVSIRFKFHMKHLKGDQSVLRGNTTVVNLMRNKICLLQEYIPPPNFDEPPPPPPPPPPPAAQPPSSPAVVVGTKGISQPAEAAAALPLPTLVPSVADKGSNGGGGGRTTTNSTLLLFQDPTPSLLLAGLLGGCAVTASIVFLIFFICLRRKLVPSSSSSSSRSSPLSSAYSGVGGIINSDPNSSSNNSSPACLLRQSGMGLDPKWTKESCCDSSTFKDKYSNPTSTIGSRNSYVTIASFWNDIFGTHGNSRHCTATTTTTGSPLATHQKRGGRHSCNSQPYQQQQQQQQQNTCRSGQFCSHHCHHPHNNYHMNSTFSPTHQPTCSSTNNETSTTTKGSDVSPYAYAHIVPKIAPPPPPLIEWYSESTCNNGGHIFSNNLFTFQPLSAPSPHLSATANSAAHGRSSNSIGAPLPPQVPPTITMGPSESIPIVTNNDGNSSTTTRSTGSGSLIQIDGFQCRKNLIKDGHVVERFL